RAMHRLYLVYAAQRTVYGIPRRNDPSRFLLALPPERLRQVNSTGIEAASASGGAVREWTGGGLAIGGRLSGIPGLRTADSLIGPRKAFGPLTRPGLQT